jgi:hypothetical protein
MLSQISNLSVTTSNGLAPTSTMQAFFPFASVVTVSISSPSSSKILVLKAFLIGSSLTLAVTENEITL